jgi:hypothetical protein
MGRIVPVTPACRAIAAPRIAVALFAGALAVYLANGRGIPTGDTVPARLIPVSLLREGDFDLDEFRFLYEDGRPYFLQQVRGRYVSSYPVGAAIAALPFFVPLARSEVDPESPVLVAAEKLAAAVLVALSVAAVLLSLARLVPLDVAVWLAIAYAFGTSSLSQSSQALWQHGPAQLAIATGIYAALRAREHAGWLVAAGLALGFAVVCRPGDALIVAPVAAYLLVRRGREPGAVLLLTAAIAVPLAFQLTYNTLYFGDPTRLQWSLADSTSWSTPIPTGLAGILASPSRGLVVYSPIVLFSLAGAVVAWRPGGEPLVRWLCLSVAGCLLLNARWGMWWGGTCYGPRLLADLSPVLVVLITPLAPRLRRDALLRALFAVLLVWSIGMHAIGAFCTDLGWNARRDVDRHPERLWSWSDNQPVECLQALATGRRPE